MAHARRKSNRVLVIDVGGSHVKCAVRGRQPRRFVSGPRLDPRELVEGVAEITRGWTFDVIAMGYPGVVRQGRIVRDPNNLGPGWIGFDFETALGHPVKLLNDAAMQALGAYAGGTMLFLGLGTGLGSAMVVDGVVVPLELGHLHWVHRKTYEHYVGDRARHRLGNRKWRRKVEEIVEDFRAAFQPDYIVIGGGNARHLRKLLPHTRRGGNADAITGGRRLWDRKA